MSTFESLINRELDSFFHGHLSPVDLLSKEDQTLFQLFLLFTQVSGLISQAEIFFLDASGFSFQMWDPNVLGADHFVQGGLLLFVEFLEMFYSREKGCLESEQGGLELFLTLEKDFWGWLAFEWRFKVWCQETYFVKFTL